MKTISTMGLSLLIAVGALQVSPNQQKQIEKLVSVHHDWGAEMSSPGALVTVAEDSRPGKQGRFRADAGYTGIRYLMKVSGLPVDKTYQLALMRFPALRPEIVMTGIGIRADGIVVCPGKPNTCSSEEGPNDPVDLVLPSAKGEVHHLALISADGKSKVMFTVIPFPVRSEDKGCSLELQRLMPAGALVYVAVSGMAPNQEFELKSDSVGESQSSKVKADALGNHHTALLPAVKGKDRGTVQVTVASPACTVNTSLDWGSGSDHPE